MGAIFKKVSKSVNPTLDASSLLVEQIQSLLQAQDLGVSRDLETLDSNWSRYPRPWLYMFYVKRI